MQVLSPEQMLTELTDEVQAFIRRQEMMFVSTGVDQGDRDCSFVAGGPGFVRVLDVKRLAWPEFGATSAVDVGDGPEISLLFVDLARGEVALHVNGIVKVLDDDAMRRAYRQLNHDPALELVALRRPDRWITVYVEQAFRGVQPD